jgi:hypothetical protein
MPNNYDIFLRFISDQAAQQKVEKDVGSLNKKLEETEKHVHDISRFGHDAGLVKAMEEAAKTAQTKLNPALKESVKHEKDLAAATKHAAHEAHLQMQIFDAQAMKLSAQASLMTKRASELTRISSRVGQYSTIGFGLGAAAVGGIFAESNRYAKEVEGTSKATQATREWTRATQELATARERVDRVLLDTALPLLEKAADIATKASQFIEKHPEIAQAALNTGLIVAGLGAVGIAVSKGIQLKADQLYLAAVPIQLEAAQLQIAAAEQMLVAAHLQAEASKVEVVSGAGGGATTKAAGAGGILAGIASPAGSLALIAATAVAINSLTDNMAKLQTRLFETGNKSILPLIGVLDSLSTVGLNPMIPIVTRLRMALERDIPLIKKKIDDLIGTTRAAASGNVGLGGARGSVGGRDMLRLVGSEAETQRNDSIVKIFSKWKEDDARLIQDAADNRRKVIEQSERAIADATRKYAQQRVSINAQFNSARADIIQDFAADSQQAELDYANNRADIIRDSGEDIRQIEEDHQERIRKMTLDHNDNMASLTADRDALGLVKEQRRFDRERTEAERETNQEIAQRRRDTAIRLQELTAEFAQERAQRQAKFQQDLVENEQRRQEELKQAAAAHTEEMNQLRQQKADRLREIQQGLIEEQRRRREFFLAEIRDLDSSLLGEKNLKVRYYNEMLRDADTWLAAYRAKLATAGGDTRTATTPVNTGSYPGYTPLRDEGGYMGKGLYRVAWNGVPEFAMSGRTTRAAEQIIGGRLTQDALLGALANGGRGGRNININLTDSRQFDRMPASWEREQMNREMVEALEKIVS